MKYKIKIGSLNFIISIDKHFFISETTAEILIHNHAAFEVHCFFEGNGNFRINDKFYPVGGGILFIIPPGTYHCDTSNGSRKCIFQFKYYNAKKSDDAYSVF